MTEKRAGLVYCRACGHEVSEKATACPNCGEPAAENRTIWEKSVRGGQWMVAVAVGLLVVDIALGTSFLGGLGLFLLIGGGVTWIVGWAASRWA